MKRILATLLLLPLSGFAMENKDEYTAVISLTRDGDGEKKVVLFSPNGKEVKTTFPMFSCDLKSKYEYTVALSLFKLKNKHPTIEGYVSRAQFFRENNSTQCLTETLKIDEKVIPVNEQNVMKLHYLSDMKLLKGDKKEGCPVTLGLIILDLPKAKL